MSPNQIVMLVLFTAGVMLAAGYGGHIEAKDEHNYKPELLPSLNTMAAALLTCTLLDHDTLNHIKEFFEPPSSDGTGHINVKDDSGKIIQETAHRRHLGCALVVLAVLIGSSAASPKKGISAGLVVAVVLNFALDGLMVRGEVCKKDEQMGLGFGKVIGFLADNIVLMLILGFQFQKSGMSQGSLWGALVGVVAVFLISMYCGLTFSAMSKKSIKHMTPTISAVVILYTIFCELMPDSNKFEDFDNKEITPDDSDSWYIRNYDTFVQPLIFFVTFMGYMKAG